MFVSFAFALSFAFVSFAFEAKLLKALYFSYLLVVGRFGYLPCQTQTAPPHAGLGFHSDVIACGWEARVTALSNPDGPTPGPASHLRRARWIGQSECYQL